MSFTVQFFGTADIIFMYLCSKTIKFYPVGVLLYSVAERHSVTDFFTDLENREFRFSSFSSSNSPLIDSYKNSSVFGTFTYSTSFTSLTIPTPTQFSYTAGTKRLPSTWLHFFPRWNKILLAFSSYCNGRKVPNTECNGRSQMRNFFLRMHNCWSQEAQLQEALWKRNISHVNKIKSKMLINVYLLD